MHSIIHRLRFAPVLQAFTLAALLCVAGPPLLAGIQITEVMLNPADAGGMPDASYEFLELYNDGAAGVNLQNWTITTSFSPPLTITASSLVVPPLGYLVIGKVPVTDFNAAYNVALTAANYVDHGGVLPLFENTGDYFRVDNAAAVMQAELSVRPPREGWPSDNEGTSFALRRATSSATPTLYQSGSNWINQADPALDILSVLNDAGGYSSPGRGPVMYWSVNTWDGGGGADNRWSNPLNWASNTVPTAGTVVAIGDDVTQVSINLDDARSVFALLLQGSQPCTISGAGTLTVTGGHVISHSFTTAEDAVYVPLVLGGAFPWMLVENSTLVLHGGVTGTGVWTKTGNGTLYVAGNVNYGGRYAQSLGTLELADRTLTAANLSVHGTVNDSGTIGTLRTTGTLTNYSANWSSLPSLIMQPPVGNTTLLPFVNGLNRLEISGAGTVRLTSSVSCLHLDVAAGTLDLNGIFNGVTLTNGIAQLRAGATLRGQGGGLVMQGGGRILSEGITTVAEPSIVASPGPGQTLLFDGSAPLTGLGILNKQNAGTLILSVDVAAKQFFQGGGITDLNDHTLTVTGGPALTTTLAGFLTDNGTAGTLILTTNVSNTGVTLTSQPHLTMAPPNAADVLAVNSLNGVGTFTAAGAGTTRMTGVVNAAGLDCASGLLDCNGIGGAVTVTSGTARLRAGASLRGFGGGLTLLGSSEVISEGISMVAGAAISVSPAAGQTTIITGTAPLAGLSLFIKANAGTVRLDVDVSAHQYGQHAGTMDLNDRTLSVLGVPGFAISTDLTGTLTDSGTAGTLFVATRLNNVGVTFTSLPNLTMAPRSAADVIQVQGFNGIGIFRTAGTGTTQLIGNIHAASFDAATGTLDLNGVSPGIRVTDGTARLRAAATLKGGGSIEVSGNSQVVSEGVTTVAAPALIVGNNAGQTTAITGSTPLTGLGFLSKHGAGTLQLSTDVSARMFTFNAGTVDLNGRTVSATGGPSFTSTLAGTLTDSGTAGTLLVSTHLNNTGVNPTSLPNLTMAPLNPTDVLTVNSFFGLGTFTTAGTGITRLIGVINCAGFDAAGGTLELNGVNPGVSVRNGTTRLRTGAALKGPGHIEVLGTCQILSEGVTTVSDPGLIEGGAIGQTTVITGSAPLTGLGYLNMSSPGTLQLDSVDVSARQVALYSGTVDLNGRTLESTTPSAVTPIYNTLADSATGGTLKIAGTLQNISASFVSEPSLEFAPPGLFDTAGWTGLPLTGLGRVTAAGSALSVAATALACRDLDVIRGVFLSTGIVSATQNMWLRGGSVTYVGGTGSLGLLGNGQLRYEGGFLSNSPQLTVFNDTGETAGIHSTAGPFAGLGIIFKNGPGTLRLHTDVIAECLGTDYFSTTDLNGHTFTLYGLYPGLFEGAKFASGSVLLGPGTLSLERGLRNDGMSTAGAPVLEITRGSGDNARLSGEPITGFSLIRKTGVGLLIQYTNVSTDRAESLGGEWWPGSSTLTVSNGLLASGGGFGSTNPNFAGTVIINGGDVETILPGGFVDVAHLQFRSPGTTRLLGTGDPRATICRQSGTGTLDLHGRSLQVNQFNLEQGTIHDSLTGGQILYPQIPVIDPQFNMTGGILDALVEGSPVWRKNAFTTTTIRGFLESNGDDFIIEQGTVRIELTAPEDFNAGYMVVKPGTALSGRARLYDGNVNVEQGGRLRPDAIAGALSFGTLILQSEAVLEIPAIAGAAPLVVPPGDYLGVPEFEPGYCILVQVTGAPVAGQTYNLFTWAGATMDGPPPLALFQLHNSAPGHLQFNGTGDTLQFTATTSAGYEIWKAQHFTPVEQADALISGPEADPDHDGLTNLMEYALTGLPKFADAADRFDFSETTWHGLPALTCRFTLNRRVGDVIIEPEFSTDLLTWFPANLEPYGEKTAITQEYIAWTLRDTDRKQFRVRFRR